MTQATLGARFDGIERRGKYLLFHLVDATDSSRTVLGHLGMTGRMYLQPAAAPLPKHAVAACGLDSGDAYVFEDTRYFGRLTLDLSSLEELGPEPLGDAFTAAYLKEALARSSQAIKVKLLDQSLLAGVGNIYASEALFQAGISPRQMARRLKRAQVEALVGTVREVLATAIDLGSTLPLDFAGSGASDGLFYYGSSAASAVEERFAVYDREGEPCRQCEAPIRRIVQAARSTFFCPDCQRA